DHSGRQDRDRPVGRPIASVRSDRPQPASDRSPVDSATVLLMLLAGLLHASWHALVKSGTGRLASLAGMGLVSGSAAACTRPFLRLLPAAAAAGFTVAAYSVVDGYGVRAAGDWSVFTAWLIVLDTAVFLLLARALRGPRLWPELGANRWPTLISGLFGLGS